MEQQLSIGFGMSNSWAPMMLKAVAEALLIDDEEVRAEVVAYLKADFLKDNSVTDAQAASEAEHRYHSFIRKNHKYHSGQESCTILTTIKLLQYICIIPSKCMAGARYMRRSPDTPAKTMAKLAKIFSMYYSVQCVYTS